jgi:hypothetical protein
VSTGLRLAEAGDEGVDVSDGEIRLVVAVVARRHHDRLDVVVQIESVLPEHVWEKHPGRALWRVDADSAALQLLDRLVVLAGE